MSLKIASNIASQAVQRNLKRVSDKSQLELERLSSGRRITKSTDDAAGLAIGSKLESQTRGLKQAARNTNDGISLVQTAEGGLNEISSILMRLRELTVQSASDTVADAERELLDMEYQQLLDEVDRISESTVFNGTHLLNGESGRGVLSFQVGTFDGDENRIEYDADDAEATTSAIGISGSEISDIDGALDSMEEIDESIEEVSRLRARIGSVQTRLHSTVSNLEVQILNQDNARSVIQDVDVAESTARLASLNVIKSAAVASLVQANNLPNTALRLIG
ncbi:MAG: flagellin FliC [Bdellovibrionales bacterium]|nr:flagellin FliC [Bdellovibrionales bacterium]MBT3526062.1 flagellin FliC [Bdellovibrionales bacterium]MBT7669980.1 flagellin FliC [Bdellovibrionales bacterium]MBT7768087.1 flagellin FliC [Bdellovibrionales bacterium]